MEFDVLRPYLPSAWVDGLAALPLSKREQVQEIRLRRGRPVRISTPMGEWYLCREGLTALSQKGVFWCEAATLERCFFDFCQRALYAHEQELKQGFLSVAGGVRVGVAGRVVSADGRVQTVTDVTSLCIRLPRVHRGCAEPLLRYVLAGDTIHSMLLVGAPSSGKTSLLRDLAATLAARRLRVAVVDERGELSGGGGLVDCDVLVGCPKAPGLMRAVRCLAPQVVLFDELGDTAEIQAVAACAHAGVAVVASMHGDAPSRMSRKPTVQVLATEGMFDRWVFLRGRRQPGQVAACVRPEVKGCELDWCPVDDPGRDGVGAVLCPSLGAAG